MCIILIYLVRAQSKVKDSIFRTECLAVEKILVPYTAYLKEKTNTLVSHQFIGPKEILIFCFKTKLLTSYANSLPSSLILYRTISLNSNICKPRGMTKCARSGQRRGNTKEKKNHYLEHLDQ